MSRTPTSLLAALALLACGESTVVEPVQEEALSLSVSPSRPAGGTCSLVSRTILTPEPGQPLNVRRLELHYVCQLLHLGRATASTQETATFTGTGTSVVNSTTYTAANGDQIFVTFNGTATIPDQNGVVRISGTETVNGGTGRFAGAAGSLARSGIVSVVTVSGKFELSGTLSY